MTVHTDASRPPAVRMVDLTYDRDSAAVLDLDLWAFPVDEDGLDRTAYLRQLEWDRTVGAYLPGSDRLAGLHSTYTFELPVPGASVAAGGLTWVGVHPEFRRRGILRAMMRRQLDDVRARGEVVSVLWAAEPAIYGRFGYGLAARALSLTVPRGAALRDVPGTDELVVSFERAALAEHGALVQQLHTEAARQRPGWVLRSRAELTAMPFQDGPAQRRGTENLRIAVVRAGGPDGPVRGYALFRRAMSWGAAGPDGTVRVREAVALDAAAARVLWGRLSDLDLMNRVETDRRATDDPLVHQLVDLRATTPTVTDVLWLRLVDVPAALAGRRYTAPVDVVLGLTDAFCPGNAGTWRLRGGPDGATCTRTDAAADLSLDVRDLGAAYLGGETLRALAGAGVVTEHREGTLDAASQAFAWHVAPSCPWTF